MLIPITTDLHLDTLRGVEDVGSINRGVLWCLWWFECAASYCNKIGCGSSSVAERQLPKLNVAGSIPVSRSNKMNNLQLEIS